jgi:hypothetical protein
MSATARGDARTRFGASVGRDEATASLRAARSAALYLLSLHAAASAGIAWGRAPEPFLFALQAAALAAALLVGEWLAPDPAATLEPAVRFRLRVALMASYSTMVAIALGAALGTGDVAVLRQEVAVFTAAQVVFLLLLESSRSVLAPLANALVLVVLASLRGGGIAATAVTGYLALVALVLGFDHPVRLVGAHRTGEVSLVRASLVRSAALAAPVVVLLAAFFAIAPPTPYSRVPLDQLESAEMPEEVAAAYRRLVMLALAGGALLVLAGRLLRRSGRGRSPSEELLVAELGAVEMLTPGPPKRRVDYAGARGRIVRAYVRMLGRAREAGFIVRPLDTPLSIARHLRAPAAPLDALTALFVRARYGPDEPDAADVRAAEDAAHAVAAGLGRGLSTARRTATTPTR